MASETKKQKNKAYASRGPSHKIGIFRILITIIAIIFVIFSLLGFINQKEAVTNIVDFYKNAGENAYNIAMSVFGNDPESPIDITDNGVYLKGHAPEGSEYILDDEAGQLVDTNN